MRFSSDTGVVVIESQNDVLSRAGKTLAGFTGSGADWLAELKPHIEDGTTIVAVARLGRVIGNRSCAGRS